MRCTECGMPLSPTNTSMECPRCHTVNGVGPKPAVPLPPQMPFPSASLPPVGTTGWQQNQGPFAPTGQMWQQGNPQTAVPVAMSMPPSLPNPVAMEMNVQSSSAHYAMPNRIAGGMYSAPAPVVRPQPPRMSNVGFIVAGLCVIAGALLLVFVYVMAQTLPLTSTNTITASPPTSVSTIDRVPSPTAVVYTPTVVISPTAGAFAGQQYIDNPQMASAVNVDTAQPLQVTKVFRVNQRIYVTFDIHPDGNNGAVCLMWYLNSRIVTQFPFAVTASARAAYSYAVYGSTGAGYVEIYWASSVACTDKLLAQHVNFTVMK